MYFLPSALWRFGQLDITFAGFRPYLWFETIVAVCVYDVLSARYYHCC